MRLTTLLIDMYLRLKRRREKEISCVSFLKNGYRFRPFYRMIEVHLVECSKVSRAKEWEPFDYGRFLWQQKVVQAITGVKSLRNDIKQYWTLVCRAKGQQFHDIWGRTNLQGRKIIKRKVLLFLCLCVAPWYLEIVVSSLVWEVLCRQIALDT